MMTTELNRLELWLGFGAVIIVMLIVDLAVINRKAHIISLKEAAWWSAVWIAVSLLFNLLIYHLLGRQKALEFLTGYIVEKSLSVDNIFVFIVIFSYFSVPQIYQPRILKWGIIGAIVMRALLILAGLELLKAFHWLIYCFGALLIYTGIKIALRREEQIEPEHNPVVKLFKRFFPVTHRIEGKRFFVRERAALYATPLFVALLMVETSDLMFAMDSIPAVLAITRDPFIVYTSNIFAILGLRALFFVVAGMMGLFRYLKAGVSVILCFVGLKMVLADIYKISLGFSLFFISVVLVLSILFSHLHKKSRNMP